MCFKSTTTTTMKTKAEKDASWLLILAKTFVSFFFSLGTNLCDRIKKKKVEKFHEKFLHLQDTPPSLRDLVLHPFQSLRDLVLHPSES